MSVPITVTNDAVEYMRGERSIPGRSWDSALRGFSLVFQRIGFLLAFFFVLWGFLILSAMLSAVPPQLVILISSYVCIEAGILVDICAIVRIAIFVRRVVGAQD